MKWYKKVWGWEEVITNSEKYCGKILHLDKGYRCSLHYHKLKDETFYILKGKVLMQTSGKKIVMEKGDPVHILPGMKHSFAGLEDSKILEISTQHFEDDSYRDNESGVYDEENF